MRDLDSKNVFLSQNHTSHSFFNKHLALPPLFALYSLQTEMAGHYVIAGKAVPNHIVRIHICCSLKLKCGPCCHISGILLFAPPMQPNPKKMSMTLKTLKKGSFEIGYAM